LPNAANAEARMIKDQDKNIKLSVLFISFSKNHSSLR